MSSTQETSSTERRQILVLGCEGTGKTTVIQWMKAHATQQQQQGQEQQQGQGPEPLRQVTYPTTGVEPTDIGSAVTAVEVGGAFSSLAGSYYARCAAVMFVVDASNPSQVAESSVALARLLLMTKQLQRRPFLVVVNKSDAAAANTATRQRMKVDEFAAARQPLRAQVVEVSAATGKGMRGVLDWIANL